MSIIGSVLEDVTTDVLGKIGAWQCLITFLSASLMVPCFFHTNEDIFLIQPLGSISCDPPEGVKVKNITLCTMVIERNGTEVIEKCEKWYIRFVWMIWQRKSWLIFCDDKIKIISNSIICRLGNVFGSVILGVFADNFGRRRCAVLSVSAMTVLTLMAILCNARSWFQLLVFLRALTEGATPFLGIILICEVASNEWRACLVTLAMLPRLLASLYMIPIVNTVPNMETYHFLGFLIGCTLLLLFKWIPESPQWLLYNRKIAKAETLLKRAASINKIKLCSCFSIRPVNQRVRLFLHLRTLHWTKLQLACMFVIEYLLSTKLKKKYLLLLNIFVIGAFSCSKALQGHLNDSIVKLLLSVPMASGILAQVILLEMTPRFYAINIRCTFMGCCHATASIGVICSYLLFYFNATSHSTNLILDVIVMLILAALCLAFPVVDGRELPDVLEDMDYFSDLTKPLRWALVKTDRVSLEEVELRVYSFGSNALEPPVRVPARPIGMDILRWLYRAWRQTLPVFD